MKDELKEILAKLYTLRAVMCAISVRKDEIEKGKKNIENRRKKHDEQVERINKKVASNQSKIRQAEWWLNYHPSMAKGVCFTILGILLIGVVIVLGLLTWKYVIQTGAWNGNWIVDFLKGWMDFFWFYPIYEILRIVLLLIMYALMLVIMGVAGYFAYILLFNCARENISEYRGHKYNKEVAPRQISVLRQHNQELENEHKQILQSLKEDINQEKQLIVTNTTAGRFLCKTLYQQYNDFLDARDWKNVDLLIFYFETGRVDTMKEALQEVDKQRRAEMIVQAVQDASYQISQTINIRMQELQNNMTECFSRLFDGLTLMHQSIVSQIKAGQEMQKMQLQSLTMELKESMQQKINESTIALADDVHYMRTVAEHEEIRKSNNI